jgi:hypothetical protein
MCITNSIYVYKYVVLTVHMIVQICILLYIHSQVHDKYVFCVFDGRWSRLPNILNMFEQESHTEILCAIFYTPTCPCLKNIKDTPIHTNWAFASGQVELFTRGYGLGPQIFQAVCVEFQFGCLDQWVDVSLQIESMDKDAVPSANLT